MVKAWSYYALGIYALLFGDPAGARVYLDAGRVLSRTLKENS